MMVGYLTKLISISQIFTKNIITSCSLCPELSDGSHPLAKLAVTEDDVKELGPTHKDKRWQVSRQGSMSPRFINVISKHISKPITVILNKFLSTRIVHHNWRIAKATPFFLTEKKMKAENYRPISITSQITKLLETFIRDKIGLTNHLEEKVHVLWFTTWLQNSTFAPKVIFWHSSTTLLKGWWRFLCRYQPYF